MDTKRYSLFLWDYPVLGTWKLLKNLHVLLLSRPVLMVFAGHSVRWWMFPVIPVGDVCPKGMVKIPFWERRLRVLWYVVIKGKIWVVMTRLWLAWSTLRYMGHQKPDATIIQWIWAINVCSTNICYLIRLQWKKAWVVWWLHSMKWMVYRLPEISGWWPMYFVSSGILMGSLWRTIPVSLKWPIMVWVIHKQLQPWLWMQVSIWIWWAMLLQAHLKNLWKKEKFQ